MSLSKPILSLLGSYLQNLYLNPIKTKSITSCVIASSGNLASQLISGNTKINKDSLLAFGLFGLLFGGTVPHYFYGLLEKLFPREEATLALAKQILFERLIYAPLYQLFSLYTLARLEGKNHKAALIQLSVLYLPVLEANWKWLTAVQVLNLGFVPPVLRVLVANLIGFFWAMYLANIRRKKEQQAKTVPKPE